MVTANAQGMGATSYGYDGEDRRVWKTSTAGTTVYGYDAGGALVAEYSTIPPVDNGTQYLSADHLGSTRMITDASGNVVKQFDYVPFGQEIGSGVDGRGSAYGSASLPSAPDVQSVKFTAKERDSETGLDYFGARYFSGPQGRFISPDWAAKSEPVPYANLEDPQTLNLYGYVRNNPLSKADRDGHCLLAADNETCLGSTRFTQSQQDNTPLKEKFVLPKDPSGLGAEWAQDKSNRSPARSSWVRGDGAKLDFDKGQSGKPDWGGRDHWHVTQPGEKDYDKTQGKAKGHLAPGTEADLPEFPTAGRIMLPPGLAVNPGAGGDAPVGHSGPLVFPGFMPSAFPSSSTVPVPSVPWEPILAW